MHTNERTRSPREVAAVIAEELNETAGWLDLTSDPDAAVAFLLNEGRSHRVSNELLWEYAASRWLELFRPPDMGESPFRSS